MSRALLTKHRQHCGDAVENTFDVDVDHVFPILHAQVVQRGDRPNAGVVDENVKLAVALTRQIDETRYVLALSHVSLCIGDFPTRPFDPTSERLQPIQSARTEYDFRAALREHDRRGFTYAAARPGYDDDLVLNSVVFHFQYLIYLDLLGCESMILVRLTRCQDWLRIVQALAIRSFPLIP